MINLHSISDEGRRVLDGVAISVIVKRFSVVVVFSHHPYREY